MFAPGELLEQKYRIVRLIGEGGMGSVFEAEAIRLHRRVAIKVLHAGSESEGETAARFQLEAQAAGRIGSRHIVEVIDLGHLPSGSHYMVMEFLEGQSLRERIATRGRMREEELYPIATQLIVGVAAAHAAGIIHRDLKPDNVFLARQPDGQDFVKILDFGISKFNDPQAGPDRAGLSLTRTGALMGTPFYLSPEQANGSKSIDRRTDLYTLGVILYECVTGVVPHQANTFNELLFRIVLEPPPAIYERVPDADSNFVAFIEHAMAKDPSLRFQSAEEMGQALELWARGEPLAARLGAETSEQRASLNAPVPRSSVATPVRSEVALEAAGTGATERRAATIPSASEGSFTNHTVDPWSQSSLSSASSPSDARATGKSKRLWLAFAVLILASAGAGMMLIQRESEAEHGTEIPSSAASSQVAPPLVTALTTHPVVEPATNPTTASPSAAPDTQRATEVSAPSASAAAARSPARGAGRPRGTPAASNQPEPVLPPAPVAPVASPAPVAPASAPATDSDVSRIRGGRAIRSDL